MKTTEKIVNIETGEETVIERDLTPIEIAEREKLAAELASRQEEEATKASLRALVLNRLGITEEEAKALLG